MNGDRFYTFVPDRDMTDEFLRSLVDGIVVDIYDHSLEAVTEHMIYTMAKEILKLRRIMAFNDMLAGKA